MPSGGNISRPVHHRGKSKRGAHPAGGKISAEIFEQLIFPNLDTRRGKILSGPQHRIDVGVVDLGPGQVIVLTTDPFEMAAPQVMPKCQPQRESGVGCDQQEHQVE